MKKIKLLFSVLLTMILVFGLTACSAGKNTDDNGEVSAVNEDNESSEENEISENTGVFSDPLPNNGMGIENGNYFATPLHNGEPIDITAMNEIRIVTDDYDISPGATINLADLNFTVVELDSYEVYLGTGNYSLNYDDLYVYEREYEVYLDYSSAFEDWEEDATEVIEDIYFSLDSNSLYGFKRYDDLDIGMCVSIYFGDADYDVDEEMTQLFKTEIQSIFANTTLTDSVEPEFATIYDFDAVEFDCGWYFTDVTCVSWDAVEIEPEYEDESLSFHAFFSISKVSAEEMSNKLEYDEKGVYEVLTDENGKEIGYVDSFEKDDDTMKYFIRLEDGSYMSVRIFNTYVISDFNIHDWSEVEALLNNGN